jgi:hypothetical protein
MTYSRQTIRNLLRIAKMQRDYLQGRANADLRKYGASWGVDTPSVSTVLHRFTLRQESA